MALFFPPPRAQPFRSRGVRKDYLAICVSGQANFLARCKLGRQKSLGVSSWTNRAHREQIILALDQVRVFRFETDDQAPAIFPRTPAPSGVRRPRAHRSKGK